MNLGADWGGLVESAKDGPLQWRVHLWSEQPFLGLVGLGVILLFNLLLAVGTGTWLFGVLGLAVSVMVTAVFYFPVSYRLTEEGIELRYFIMRERKAWEFFQGIETMRRGFYLGWDRRTLRFRLVPGLWVYPPRQDTLGVRDFVQAHLSQKGG